jgi:hypothetical protein
MRAKGEAEVEPALFCSDNPGHYVIWRSFARAHGLSWRLQAGMEKGRQGTFVGTRLTPLPTYGLITVGGVAENG